MDCHTSLATTRFRYPEIADLFLGERRRTFPAAAVLETRFGLLSTDERGHTSEGLLLGQS